jgi:hypothetical protein
MLSNIFWAMRSLCFDFFSLFFASVCASHNINGVSVRNDVHTTLWRRKTWHVAIWQHEREAAITRAPQRIPAFGLRRGSADANNCKSTYAIAMSRIIIFLKKIY